MYKPINQHFAYYGYIDYYTANSKHNNHDQHDLRGHHDQHDHLDQHPYYDQQDHYDRHAHHDQHVHLPVVWLEFGGAPAVRRAHGTLVDAPGRRPELTARPTPTTTPQKQL